MIKVLQNPSQIITVNTDGKNIKSGKDQNELNVLEEHSLIIENGLIKDFIKNSSLKNNSDFEYIDCKNKVLLPGLIDCHTHTVFAGSRADEFKMKLAGVDYEEIAQKGGGINSTVKSVRESSFEELLNIAKPRIEYFIEQGITTLEIKSGYGLSFYDEIKLLQVAKELNKIYPIDIVSTFLGAHTFPPEYKNDPEKYIKVITDEMLPYVAKNNLAEFCDAFCEVTAFSTEQIELIFQKASENGLKIKLHTDQFNSIGGIDLALKHNAKSIDHLEVVNTDEIGKLKGNDIVAVLLPGVSFFLNYGYAPARELIDNGIPVALSTDYNPGSSHIANLNFILSLAALKMNMTIDETISAVTINAAKALDLNEKTGSLEIGKNADISVLDTNNYADLIYSVGKNLNCMTIKNGEIIYQR